MKFVVVTPTGKDKINTEVEQINRIPEKIAISILFDDKIFCVESEKGLYIKDENGWNEIEVGAGEVEVFRKERVNVGGNPQITAYGVGFVGGNRLLVSPEGEWLNEQEFTS